MKITREADYAARIMICLARTENRVGSSEIAEKMAIPPRFALKILNKLQRSGMISSTKGIYGGYRLASDPDSLTLCDIIVSIDGDVCINNCLAPDSACERGDKAMCRVHTHLDKVNRMIVDSLSAITLSALARED